MFAVLCPFANRTASAKAKDRMECEIRAKKGRINADQTITKDESNAVSYSHSKGIDATSDVTKPVNSRKRSADHLRQIGYLRFLTCLRTRRSAFFGPARAISSNFFPFSWL